MPRAPRTVAEQTIRYLARPHTGIPHGPVASAAAWRGDALLAAGTWQTTLTPAEVDEIDAAVAHARGTGKPLDAIRAEDLPLPGLGGRIEAWRAALSDGLGVQLVRGVPVDRWTEDDAARFFYALGWHLGVPGAQNGKGELLGHVRSEGLSYDDPAVRGYRTSARLSYHCDAADVVGLLCLRTAKEGGTSRFVSSVTVWNELFARRPDLARRMFEPFELDTRGDGGVDFFPVPPCRHARGRLRVFYHADYYRTAEQHSGARKLGALEHEVLDAFDEIASTPGIYLDMDFRPGDVQLLSNHTVLHARTAYVDHDDAALRRHLLRLWLSLPERHAPALWPSIARESARLLAGLARGRLRKRLGP